MFYILTAGIVWAVMATGCIIMKKIAPESWKAYLIYGLCICVTFTFFAGMEYSLVVC